VLRPMAETVLEEARLIVKMVRRI